MNQRGFTLVEVMFAAAAAAVVIAAATGFMLKGLGWYDELSAKVEMNRHARETYDIMAYGAKSTIAGKDGTKFLYSFRGMNKAPGAPTMRTAQDALQYTSNKLTITPDLYSPMTVTCTGTGLPVPDCKNGPGPGPGPGGPGSTQTEAGWIGSDMTLDSGPKSVNNLTVNVTFVITDAFEAQRAKAPAQFSDTYRAIFALNRDENDP